MYMNRLPNPNRSERGSALAMIILSVAGLAALSAAMVAVSLGTSREQGAESLQSHADYICQAGLSQAMYQMERGIPPVVGSQQHPSAWGGGRMWVTATNVGANLTSLRASGVENGVGKSQELVVRSIPDNMWTYAMFGRDTIALNSSVTIDSYNSTLGTYASQLTGSGVSAHAHTDGNIGSNGDVSANPATWIWGDIVPGPGHTVTLNNANVSGSTTPATAPVNYPPINVPTYTNFGQLTVNNSTTVIPSGNRRYTNLTLNSGKTLTITGPANVVISNLNLRSNAAIVIDDTLGPVNLTIIDNFIMDSNATIHASSYNPASVRINMLSDNVADPEIHVQLDTVDFNSNSSIYGCVYAPEARIVIDSYFTLYGALMARILDLNSNAAFHYDENLLSAMSTGTFTYEPVAWREVPYSD
jgi:hypothetical protein